MREGAAVRALALALLALAVPVGIAGSDDTLEAETTDSMRLRGDLTVAFPGGSFFLEEKNATRSIVLSFRSGRGEIATWEEIAAAGNVQRLRPPESEPIDLTGATLTLRLDDEFLGIRATTPDHELRIAGSIDASGDPTQLTAPFARERSVSEPPFAERKIPIQWPAGYHYVGTSDLLGLPNVAFPVPTSPQLSLDGPIQMTLYGGELTIVTEEGRQTWRLGTAVRSGVGPLAVRDGARAWLEGDLAPSALPLGGGWAAAAPAATWQLEGTVAWTDATGPALVDGRVTRFEQADVRSRLQGTILPEGLGNAPALGSRTSASGDLADLRIDGRAIAPAAPASPTNLARISGLALLALTLWKIAGLAMHGALALYSRLAAADIMTHPTRKRLHAIVSETPGIHQRELHRTVGGAWGSFAFHLQMLERSGHLQSHGQGRYRLFFVPGARRDGTVAHPTTRAVLDALPADGSARSLGELSAALGISRELLRYHSRSLEGLGLANRVAMEGGCRGLARKPAGPASNRAPALG